MIFAGNRYRRLNKGEKKYNAPDISKALHYFNKGSKNRKNNPEKLG
jgi:hypothetical protein